jgi:pimeloyl-ACP methyl ester carboxylesterase
MRNRTIVPEWTGERDVFWYRRQTDTDPVQEEFVLVDPAVGTRQVFATLEELHLPDVQPSAAAARPGLLASPDGKRVLFRRHHDLWCLELESSTETRLTDDGEEAYAWGELPENSMMFVPFQRMGLVLPPVGTVFSPSGRFVVTVRADQRSMARRHMVENVPITGAARPECYEIRVQLDDEPAPPPGGLAILDLDTGARVSVDASDGLGAALMTNGASEVTWADDEARFFLLNHSMGAERAALVEVEVATGARRDVVVIDDEGLYEPNQFLYGLPLWRVLPASGEAVVFSQRDGWGHLYLYDLATGECRHQITDGELVVRDILRVDAQRREVVFVAGSGADGGNPYWRRVFAAGLDGGRQRLLTPERADHELVAPEPQFFNLVFGQGKPQASSVSPSGRFFVDHQSTVSEPPVIVLRDADADGAIVLELERTDVSRLEAAGYVVPEPFCVKADDGVTDLWGVISLPPDPVDPSSIPIVDHMYAGFQMTWAPSSYVGGKAGAHATFPSYNELGFAAVILDGRGTPGRDRTFRQWTHKQGHTGRGLADHVTAIKALKDLHPALDIDRVGVIGHSFGGYNTARSMLLFPEFFKVGVSSAGLNDARKTTYGGWSWHLGADYDRTTEEYIGLGTLHLADQLAGQLLIACGEIDENATVDSSFALVQALIRAGKRFDLKIWPGLNHYQQGPYVLMTFWDHFVQHLLGEELPRAFTPA